MIRSTILANVEEAEVIVCSGSERIEVVGWFFRIDA